MRLRRTNCWKTKGLWDDVGVRRKASQLDDVVRKLVVCTSVSFSGFFSCVRENSGRAARRGGRGIVSERKRGRARRGVEGVKDWSMFYVHSVGMVATRAVPIFVYHDYPRTSFELPSLMLAKRAVHNVRCLVPT